MKRDVLKEEVDGILSQAFWGKTGVRLNENTEVSEDHAEEAQEEVQDELQEGEQVDAEHVCPLCESHLEEPISDDQLSEHVDLMINIIDEMAQLTESDEEFEGEELDESEDTLNQKEDWTPKSSIKNAAKPVKKG
jgi:hypothetical protein